MPPIVGTSDVNAGDRIYLYTGNLVNNSKFHPVELIKLESGKLGVVKKEGGGSITDQDVYILKSRIPSVNTNPAESWSYKTTTEFSFRPGFYAVWAQNYVWLFEVLPE